MPKRKCAVSSCRNYVSIPERYCDAHKGHNNSQYNKHVRYNDENKKYSQFYNSTQWRNVRKAKLMEQPLCEVCLAQGKYTKADMVHHCKYELRDPNGWEHRLSLDNLQSICYTCHTKQEHKYSWKNRQRLTIQMKIRVTTALLTLNGVVYYTIGHMEHDLKEVVKLAASQLVIE